MKSVVMSNGIFVAGLLALMLSGTSFAQEVTAVIDWHRPNTDFSKYSKFLVKPLDISDVNVLKPVWAQDDPEDWQFEFSEGGVLQALFMTAMTKELSKDGGFEIVTEDGDGVLKLEIEFLSVTPYVKPGSGDENEISTLGYGDVLVSGEVRDSLTGSLLFLVEQERNIGTEGSEHKKSSRQNKIANLEFTFRNWGKRLRFRLEQASGKRGVGPG